MYRIFAAAAALALCLGFGSAGAQAAAVSLCAHAMIGVNAASSEVIHEIGHNKKHKHGKHRRKHHKHWRGHRHWGHHHKHQNSGFFFSFGAHGPVILHGPGYRQRARRCHGITTDGTFNGRYAKIGGTICYDSAGNGYIVDGSRYLIHYY